MKDSYTTDKYASEVHWACGKVDCDCDYETDNLMDYEYFQEIENDANEQALELYNASED